MLFFEASAAVLFRVALALFDIYTQVSWQASTELMVVMLSHLLDQLCFSTCNTMTMPPEYGSFLIPEQIDNPSPRCLHESRTHHHRLLTSLNMDAHD